MQRQTVTSVLYLTGIIAVIHEALEDVLFSLDLTEKAGLNAAQSPVIGFCAALAKYILKTKFTVQSSKFELKGTVGK